MNIFSSSFDPGESARNLDDKRVVKLILESSQMLSTVRPHLGLLKPAFINHPATLWVGESEHNYGWLWNHLAALHWEFNFRFSKSHALYPHFEVLTPGHSKCNPKYFVKLVRDKSRGLDFTHIEDTHEAYRVYLRAKWATDRRPVKFTRRSKPDWF